MNVVNELVNHRQFGAGRITEQSMTTVTVEFCEEQGTKKFVYPSAFYSFLKLNDPIVKQKLDDELQEIREREELERQQRAEEEERRQSELKQKQKKKRTATKKQSSTKKKSKTKAKE